MLSLPLPKNPHPFNCHPCPPFHPLRDNHLSTSYLYACQHAKLLQSCPTLAGQAPLPVGFSRQEYWSGLPCPPPGDLPDPGIEPVSPALAGRFFTHLATWEAPPYPLPCCICPQALRTIRALFFFFFFPVVFWVFFPVLPTKMYALDLFAILST